MKRLANNPNYRKAFTAFEGTDKEVIFYEPIDSSNYHYSRILNSRYLDKMGFMKLDEDRYKLMINEAKNKLKDSTIKPDDKVYSMTIFLSALEANMALPDEMTIAVKSAALFLFVEGEDPNKIDQLTQLKKEQIAYQDPKTLAFFLACGIALLPRLEHLKEDIEIEDYLNQRNQALNLVNQMMSNSLKMLSET